MSQLTALSYWTFSDIFDELVFDPIPFHDGYGLLTVQGVPKPACVPELRCPVHLLLSTPRVVVVVWWWCVYNSLASCCCACQQD